MREASKCGLVIDPGLGGFGHILFCLFHCPAALATGWDGGPCVFCAAGCALKRGTNAGIRQLRYNFGSSI